MWKSAIITTYTKGLDHEDGTEVCIIQRDYNSFFMNRVRNTMDRKEWETIGKIMDWKQK